MCENRHFAIMKTFFSFFCFVIFVSNVAFCELNDDFYDNWLEEYRKVSGKSNPPTKYKEWINIARELKCSTNPSDYKHIFSDLRTFRDMNITIGYMQKYEQKIRNLGLKIEGYSYGRIMMVSRQYLWPFTNSWIHVPRVLDPSLNFYVLIQLLDEGMCIPADLNPEQPYKDMEDVFSRSESLRKEFGEYSKKCIHLQAPTSFNVVPYNVPIFSKDRLRGSKDIILPTYQTGLLPYLTSAHKARGSPKWDAKLKSAVFRGRPTGINFDKVRREAIPLTNNPRFKLHEMSMKQAKGQLNCSVKLDFGVNSISDCVSDQEYLKEVKKQFPEASYMDFTEQFKHKYLVVVDGHGWPDRIGFYMLSGSLVFLATLHDDWTSTQIIDGEHYVKVKPDLSDLIEKIEWAAANDDEARLIAEKGRKFASEKLGLNYVQAYNALLFMEYQSLFNNGN